MKSMPRWGSGVGMWVGSMKRCLVGLVITCSFRSHVLGIMLPDVRYWLAVPSYAPDISCPVLTRCCYYQERRRYLGARRTRLLLRGSHRTDPVSSATPYATPFRIPYGIPYAYLYASPRPIPYVFPYAYLLSYPRYCPLPPTLTPYALHTRLDSRKFGLDPWVFSTVLESVELIAWIDLDPGISYATPYSTPYSTSYGTHYDVRGG
eukprot:654063-Rhodomonas_salina.1